MSRNIFFRRRAHSRKFNNSKKGKTIERARGIWYNTGIASGDAPGGGQ
jgi:hypothetical protein